VLRLPATLLIALAVTAAGCGSGAAVSVPAPRSASPKQVIAAAADATRKSGTARLAMTITMTMGTQGTTKMTATGAMDFRGHRAGFHWRMAQPGRSPQSFDQRIDGTTIFTRITQDPAGRWLKTEIAAIAPGTAAGTWSNGSTDPAQLLDYLRGASSSIVRIGEERIRGVRTTHYRAVIDFDRMVRNAPAGQRKALARSLEQARAAGIDSLPIEVWVDADGVVRREVVNMSFENTLLAGMSMSMSIDLFDFGTTVDLAPPPAAKVVEYPGSSSS